MQTRRVQMLMDPSEHRALSQVAKLKGVSLGELLRLAARTCYLPVETNRMAHLQALTQLQLDLGDWQDLAGEIAEAHDGGLS